VATILTNDEDKIIALFRVWGGARAPCAPPVDPPLTHTEGRREGERERLFYSILCMRLTYIIKDTVIITVHCLTSCHIS